MKKLSLVVLAGMLGFLFIPFCFSADEPITSPRCNQFTFDASGSYDPDNGNISFLWDFGDGTTTTTAVSDHTYEKPGDYDVTLTIKDETGVACSSSAVHQKVRAIIPPKVAFDAPEMVCSNQKVIFDAAKSGDNAGQNITFSWNFGDGTRAANEKVVAKTYEKGGRYVAALTGDNNSKTECSKNTFEKTIIVNDPPIAEAGEEKIMQCVSKEDDMVVHFDGSNSSDVNNDPLTYYWDFGDGATAEGKQVSHRYLDVGNYDVKLIAKDNTNIGCGSAVDFMTVHLSKSPIANAGDDTLACIGDKVAFDGSQSFVEKKGTATATWAFGDGETADGFTASHTYLKPGQYQATLNVENDLNKMCPLSQDTKLVTVNATPSVVLKGPESVCLGTPVGLEASANDADGDPLEFYWSFGDGSISKGEGKVSHNYEKGGLYRSTVIVDDGRNTSCSTSTAEVQVRVNTPPMADAGANSVCCLGVEAEFNASASSDPDGDRLTYAWDFGDGTKAFGPLVKHSFDKSGKYNVNVTVDDNSGTVCSKSSAGFVAEVNAKPVPVINIR